MTRRSSWAGTVAGTAAVAGLFAGPVLAGEFGEVPSAQPPRVMVEAMLPPLGRTLDEERLAEHRGGQDDAYANINGKQKSTHALGFNEPDRPDQAVLQIAVFRRTASGLGPAATMRVTALLHELERVPTLLASALEEWLFRTTTPSSRVH
jgi:hypothetical protein